MILAYLCCGCRSIQLTTGKQPPAAHPRPSGSSVWPSPVSSAGPTSRKMPPNPIIKPRIASQLGLTPPGRDASMLTIHIGIEPMISAAIPDGTYCSANETSPLPPSSRKIPTIAVERHWRFVGHGVPGSAPPDQQDDARDQETVSRPIKTAGSFPL